MNPYAWWLDYGNSNWDVRHRFVGSFMYDLPFFRSSGPAAARYLLGGWQLNGIVIAQTGTPFNVTVPGDPANVGLGSQRPNIIGPTSSDCGQGKLTGCIANSAFALPSDFTYGNAGRNLLRGPSLVTCDLSTFKNISLRERLRLQIRGEAFNLLNHPNFSNPASVFSTAAFGNITATSTNNRQLQLAVKVTF